MCTESCDPKLVCVAGVPVVSETRSGFASVMLRDVLNFRKLSLKSLPKLAFSLNGQALSLYYSDNTFMNAMNHADYIQADGQSIVIASKLLSVSRLPQRIATTDFFYDAAAVAQKNKIKFYLLGSDEATLNQACKNINGLYPKLEVVGSHSGFFKREEEDKICKDILNLKAEVLWVGMGKPKEQNFCLRNREKLNGIAWIKTCGGLFDFLAEKNKRAPLWMQQNGLEWLYRTYTNPRKFLRRYITTNFHSIYLFIKYRKKTLTEDENSKHRG